MREILKQKLVQNKVEESAENYANALGDYKIRFNSNMFRREDRAIEEDLAQIEIDIDRNMILKIGEEDITREVEEARAKGGEVPESVITKAVERIKTRIPEEKQVLIFSYLHQGAWGNTTSMLFNLIKDDQLSKVGDPHLKMKQVIKVSEDYKTSTGEFTICTEVAEGYPNFLVRGLRITTGSRNQSKDIFCSWLN